MVIHVQPTVISIFAGCGGSSLGYKLAGFKELLAIDFDDNAVETFKLNFDSPIWNKDIAEISGQQILEFTGLKKTELDILDGSPPCQGFSMSGKRNVDDERNDLFRHFVRLINELEPKVFVMENVPGMIVGKMKGRFNEILGELQKSNYVVKCKLMNAMYYNVAQSRKRLIFIGVRKDLGKKPVFPKPSNNIISVYQALKDIDNSNEEIKTFKGEKTKCLISLMKQGTNMAKLHPNGSGFNTVRLAWHKPSNTIVKTFREQQSGLLHPEENRFMTIKELKALSSFPDDFKFAGAFEDKWARIGNAVMPNMMKEIALAVKKEILEAK